MQYVARQRLYVLPVACKILNLQLVQSILLVLQALALDTIIQKNSSPSEMLPSRTRGFFQPVSHLSIYVYILMLQQFLGTKSMVSENVSLRDVACVKAEASRNPSQE
jgi:hypothetical protein